MDKRFSFSVTVRRAGEFTLAIAVVSGHVVATGRGDDVIDALNVLGSKIGPVIDDKLNGQRMVFFGNKLID